MFSAWAPTLISRVLFTFWFYIKTGKPPTHPIHPLGSLAPVHGHGGSEVLVDPEGLPHKARSRLEMLPVMEDIVICHDDIGRCSYLKYCIGTINIELLCRAWCDTFCKIILQISSFWLSLEDHESMTLASELWMSSLLCVDAKGSKDLKRMNIIGHLIEEVMQYEYLHMLQVKC